MGQKVHPIGFRVGITKPYQSQWFARFHKYQYSQTILEDHHLRQTLIALFPKLLNPKLNVAKKKDEKTVLTPKITHIKIERGLVPYQIGIQIHAENCEIIKSAIENLKVSNRLQAKLQKVRYYLNLLQQEKTISKSKQLLLETSKTDEEKKITGNIIGNLNAEKSSKKRDSLSSSFKKNKKKTNIKNFEKFGQKRSRLKSRRIRTKSRLILLQKKNSRYIASTLKKSFLKKSSKKSKISSNTKIKNKTNKFKTFRSSLNKKKFTKKSRSSFAILAKKIRTVAISSSNQTAKKILNLFLSKTQNKFFKHLKEQLKYWSEQTQSSPLGSNRKWNLKTSESLENSFLNKFKNKSINKLTNLVQRLEKKAFKKMEHLRVDFIATGPLSKAQTFGYYQIITFLKYLKEYIMKQRTIRTYIGTAKLNKENSSLKIQNKKPQAQLGLINTTTTEIKLANIEKEYSKIKFIEYLKEIIQKHRQENIFYYLPTIIDSQKNLREIQNFTKRHADFLFDLDLKTEKNLSNKIKDSLQNPNLLQEVFLKQIEKQRKINLENNAFTPKISIKFYNAPSNVIDTKATIVADTVVDALEKRQAFRKVIKQAMSTAIKNPRVKGVKIQVAGRLNGAEIARTEWVRSGRVPLQTLTANIDYAYKTANTIYGIIGIKVWLFKGYLKTS